MQEGGNAEDGDPYALTNDEAQLALIAEDMQAPTAPLAGKFPL